MAQQLAPGDIDYRPDWVADAIFYQIFPDRFARSETVAKPSNLEPWDSPPTVHGYKGGDLVGVAEHLDWLAELGVNAVYFNPIFQSAANHRYHTHDYYRIDPLLGGHEAFEVMIDACHRRGIKVVLDGVFNHASRGFFRFNDTLESGGASPWLDWFHIQDPDANAYDMSRPPGYLAWWGLHALPKFNTDNPAVREYLMGVAEHWIRLGIDGWRLDVPQEIATEGFWEEFRARVRAINPDAYIVGEIWDPAADWIGKSPRFDGVMNYQLTEVALRFGAAGRIDREVVAPVNMALDDRLDGEQAAAGLRRILDLYPDDAHRSNLNLLGSHDTPRVLSMVSGDHGSVHLAAAMLFTLPGAPCIYYGDEIGMAGTHDPGSRGGFPWDRTGEWHGKTLDYHRSLTALRSAEPTLRWGGVEVAIGEGNTLGYIREHEGDRLLVVLNAGDEREHPWCKVPATNAELIWGSGEARTSDDGIRVAVPGRSAGVWRLGG